MPRNESPYEAKEKIIAGEAPGLKEQEDLNCLPTQLAWDALVQHPLSSVRR